MLPTVQLPIQLQNIVSSLLQLPFFSPSYPPVFCSSSPLVFSRLHLLIPLPIFHLRTSLPLHISSLMADMDHSSSDDVSDDSRVSVQTSQDSKLGFSEDEETLIERMFNLIGERWTLIAGRIPGRTAEEIEKYWTTRYSTSD